MVGREFFKLFLSEILAPLLLLALSGNATAGSGFTPFSAFGARAEIALGITSGGDCFDLWVLFTLGAGSDGIDPVAEAVTLSVGTGKWVIPPGSFRKDDLGRYRAEALIGPTLLEMMIRALGRNEFELRASAAPARPAGSGNLVAVSLTIGNDGGKTDVLAEIWPCSPGPRGN